MIISVVVFYIILILHQKTPYFFDKKIKITQKQIEKQKFIQTNQKT